MDIKEIVNLLYTAIDLAADGGPAAFTDEEYSEMHELLKKIKSGQFGWHPASELPPVEIDIVVWCILDDEQIHVGMASLSENKWPAALEKYVKYWCYVPKN